MQLLLADIVSESQEARHISHLFGNLTSTEQRALLFSMLKIIADTHLNHLDGGDPLKEKATISAAAGIINSIVAGDAKYLSHLITWLTSATGAGLGDAIGVRRATLAVLSSERDSITSVFEKSLNQFGDYLYIRHTPVLQQEGTEDIALCSEGKSDRRQYMLKCFC